MVSDLIRPCRCRPADLLLVSSAILGWLDEVTGHGTTPKGWIIIAHSNRKFTNVYSYSFC